MAQEMHLWDATWRTPTGPCWVAAGHVHPITGEGIACALWPSELLADAVRQGEPKVYECLWREQYGRGFMAAGGMLRPVDLDIGAYEIVFQVAMVMALPVPGQVV